MDDKAKYLLSLRAVRERAKLVGEVADRGQLTHFDVVEEKLGEAADFVTGIIKRDYGPNSYDKIPPHGRWQHFEVNNTPRIGSLLEEWKNQGDCDDVEATRRLIDLFFVSVLLDAGAGDAWRYVEPGTQTEYERSEGIAVASLYLFREGGFASKGGMGVDGKGLQDLQTENLARGFQISSTNPMLGIESRANLLRSLGSSLLSHPEIFGKEGRPGNVVDYMKTTSPDAKTLDILTFWDILQTLLIPIWPQDRTVVNGQALGDAWPLSTLKTATSSSSTSAADETSLIQPFHKLTQWLAYSLTVPFTRILHYTWTNTSALTALPEYRNGGLFVDLGVLVLKPASRERGVATAVAAGLATGENEGLPAFAAGDDVVVEWRAMTLVLVDRLYKLVLERMGGAGLSMAQLLEAGTWKAGREVARERRPVGKGSPVLVVSDGTVF